MGLTRIRAEQISNIDYKQSVRVITLANVNLSGGAPATVDGVALLSGNRILVAGQEDRRQNGIYQVSTVGAGNTGTWIRSRDANETGEIEAGMIVMVTEGTVYKDTQWKLITNDPIVVDETELDFQRNTAYDFGNIYANGTAVLATVAGDTVTLEPGLGVAIVANAASKTITISAGTANPSGNVGEIQYNSGSNTLAASANLSFDGSNLTVGGHVAPLANMQYDLGNATNYWRSLYVGGNTIYLGNLQLKEAEGEYFGVYQSDGTTPAVINTLAANAEYANTAGTASTVTANAQPNITSVGTLSNLVVSGNVFSNNLIANTVSGGNISIANDTISGLGSTITLDPSAPGSTGLVIVAGNLQVQGTTTTIDSTVVTINDLAITVANNAATPSEANGGGIIVAGADASMLYNSGSNSFVFNHSTVHQGANINGALTGATTGSFSGNVDAGNISATTGAFTTVTGDGYGLSNIAGANVNGTVANASYATAAGSAETANTANTATTATSATTATTAGTVTTAAQPNITSVGTLSSLTVTGNVGAGNVSATNGTFTNVIGNGSGLSSITGANVTGTVANAIYATSAETAASATTAGTVTTSAQPNITSVGTLSSLIVAGNTSVGNISATTGTFTTVIGDGSKLSNISGANVEGTVPSASYATSAGSSDSANVAITATTVTANAQPNITSVGTLTSLTVTGNVSTGNVFGSLGAFTTVTGNGAGLSSITGANVTGTVANATYATTADSATSATTAGTVTTNAQPNITSVGTLSSLTVTGNVSTGNVSGTTGTFTIVAGQLTTAEQPNITGVGNLTNLIVTGNVSAETGLFTNVSGNGFSLSNITGANVTGIVANATYATSAGSATTATSATIATTAGTVTTASQPNITSVGTLSSLTVSGNVSAGNVSGTLGAFTNVTGDGAGLSSITGANVTGTVANATYATSAGTSASATTAGTVTTAAQPNITSVGTLSSLTVSGNVSTGNISGATGTFTTVTGNGSALTSLDASNISTGTLAQARLANASLTVNGVSITLGASGTVTANTTQTLTRGTYLTGSDFNGGTATTWAVDAASAATASKVVARDANASFAGNVITATTFSGSGASLTAIPGANVTGTVANATYATSAGSATSATTAGTVTTNAQPNITSVGTLTSLTVNGFTSHTGNVDITGNLNVTGNLNYANVSDLVVGDPLIYIGAENPGNVYDLGIVVSWTDSVYQHGGWVRDSSDGVWKLFGNVVEEPTTTIDFTNAIYQPMKVGAITATTGTFSGNVSTGNISGTLGSFTNVTGNGAGLSSIAGANVTGTVANATYATSAGSATSATTAGTVTTAAQPNITSVGTLSSLTVTGNVSTGNVSGTTGAFTNVSGNGAGLSSITGANVTGTVANATYATSAGSATTSTTAGTVTTAAQPNITSVGTLTSLTVTGNVTSGNVSGTTGAFTTVTGNGRSLTSLNASNLDTGTVPAARLSGTYTITVSGAATTAGTVTTAAQPNITSVGTLTSVTSSGAVTATSATGYVNLGLDSGGAISLGLINGNTSSPYIDFNTSATAVDYNVRLQASGNTGVGGGTLTISAASVAATGALSATGNISGSYFIGNGSLLTGIAASGGVKWTTSATAPASPNPGDFWYDTDDDKKYQYTNFGTGNAWVDLSFPSSYSILSVGSLLNTNANGVGNIGSAGGYYNTVFAKATSAQYADLAEMYQADAAYEPGTVVVFGGDYEVSVSSKSHDTRVAGVVSTNPSYLMNAGLDNETSVAVALTGRVPCWVQGPVEKGDRLVNHKSGVAGKLEPGQFEPGCIIGKSLEIIEDDSIKLIEIAIGRY